MVDQDTDVRDIEAVRGGRAWVDLSERRAIRVSGTDAIGWLHDLLTADIAGLVAGAACRSLLLTPTGYIRADVHVVRRDDDVMLIQDRRQDEDIRVALEPYVLSADVRLDDASDELAIFALPGRVTAPDGLPGFSVSALGAGVDVVVPATSVASARDAMAAAGSHEVGHDVAEAWRIDRGVPRMGADFGRRSLPAEAALDHVIDRTKGCFLGQESIARIGNLGHPPRVLRHVRGDAPIVAGSIVRDGDDDVGEVTSSALIDARSVALVRVSWSAANARLTDIDGHPLRDAEPPG